MVLVVENRGGGESQVEWASFLQNQQIKTFRFFEQFNYLLVLGLLFEPFCAQWQQSSQKMIM
jgi:hypothetical protein